MSINLSLSNSNSTELSIFGVSTIKVTRERALNKVSYVFKVIIKHEYSESKTEFLVYANIKTIAYKQLMEYAKNNNGV